MADWFSQADPNFGKPIDHTIGISALQEQAKTKKGKNFLIRVALSLAQGAPSHPELWPDSVVKQFELESVADDGKLTLKKRS